MRLEKLAVPVLAFGLFLSRESRADCTTDVECKGDRVCVDGACAGPPARVQAPISPQETAGSAAPDVLAVPSEVPSTPPTTRRSQALFVTGIVSMSLAPVAFAAMAFGGFEKASCKMDNDFEADRAAMRRETAPVPSDCSRFDGPIYGAGAAAIVLLGGGLAMLLVGVQKVPVEPGPTAAMKLRPWLSPSAAGLGIQTTF